MTHEEFFRQLVLGFAGDSSSRQPSYAGINEEDAVLRWIAYKLANYILMRCRFQRDGGTVAIVAVERLWYRWAADEREDLDLTIGGPRTGPSDWHRIKVQADSNRPGAYGLRISDWTTRGAVDAQGDMVRRNGRRFILDSADPYVWTLPTTRERPEADAAWNRVRALRLPECCETARRSIKTVIFGTGGLEVFIGISNILGGHTGSNGIGFDVITSDWDELRSAAQQRVSPIQRERLRTICEHKILEHDSEPALRQYWENMHDALQ